MVTALLGLAVVPVVAATAMRAVGVDGVTPVAQLVAYTPWMAVPAVGLLAVLAASRRWRLTAVAGTCAIALVGWQVPFFTGYLRAVPTASEEASEFRVLSANALFGRADAVTIVELVREHDVDALVVLELTADLRDRLVAAGIEEVLPHRVDAKVSDDAAGSGIWSVAEPTEVDVTEWSSFAMPAVTLGTPDGRVRLTAIHTTAPMPEVLDGWRADLTALRHRRGASSAEYEVMAGDFNATYDHASFRSLLGDGLVDATREIGRGLNPTWSWGGGGTAPVGIDHVVTDARVVGARTLGLPGSDHRAVLATLDLGGS